MTSPKIIVRRLELEPGQDVAEAIMKSVAQFLDEQTDSDTPASKSQDTGCGCPACQAEQASNAASMRFGTLGDLLKIFTPDANENVLTEDTNIIEPAEKDLSGARLVSDAEKVSVTETADGANVEIKGELAQEIREKLLDELYVLARESSEMEAVPFLEMFGAMTPEERAERKAADERKKRRADAINRLYLTGGNHSAIASIVDELLNQAA